MIQGHDYGCQVDKEWIMLTLQCMAMAMLNYSSQNPFPCISPLRLGETGS